MTDTFLDMAADSLVPVLSGTHSIIKSLYVVSHTAAWNNGRLLAPSKCSTYLIILPITF